MLRAASLDLYDQFGICLNAVAPGPVVTNLIDSFAGRKATEKDKSTPEYEWETQQPDKPALAAAYLLTREQHGRSIAVHGGRYRDLESVYDAMRDELLGSQLGIPPVSERGWRNLFQCAFE
jgi:NAD(P)-dependent dehydrogenase (short-subunit alcohol dehydrogenase family)